MKKFLLFIPLIILSSCYNGDNKSSSSKEIAELKQRLTTLEKENSELKLKIIKTNVIEKNNDFVLLGKWIDTRHGSDNTQLILKRELKNNKVLFSHLYSDGSSDSCEVIMTKENGKSRFQEINGSHTEWYVIEKDGSLSMYSQNGKFGTAMSL